MKKAVQLVGQNYFTSPKENLRFVSTGCTVLDCALGGGFALGRIANVVGDKSTAKTGIATETLANFLRQYPEGTAHYRDTEAAFDHDYAEAMGLPVEKINFGPESPLTTVEDFAQDVIAFAERQIQEKQPGIYVVDSLDALSDEAEMKRDLGDASYGTAKAKLLSELFRKKLPTLLSDSGSILLVVSQVRDNIGAMFGEKHKRSGGRALDFYASQVVWLAKTGALKRSIKKVERVVGVEIIAKVKKNKVSMPFREAEFTFLFGYGVEDLSASVEWLGKVGKFDLVTDDPKGYLAKTSEFDDEAYKAETQRVAEIVKEQWSVIESSFLPSRKKYT